MYIWMVLATFMVLLYSYNLPVRGDMKALKIEPQAEVVVSRLVIQHRSARDYIRNRMPPKNGSNVITYTKGILSCTSDLKDYLPYGYNCDTGFTSEIYCMQKTDWSTGMDDCTSPDAMKYLITYGPVPPKWLNLSSNTPTNDLLNASRRILGIDTSFGYAFHLDASDSASGGHGGSTSGRTYKMAVRGREDNMVYIPNYVVDNGGFKTQCGCSNCHRCLVYVTPFE